MKWKGTSHRHIYVAQIIIKMHKKQNHFNSKGDKKWGENRIFDSIFFLEKPKNDSLDFDESLSVSIVSSSSYL